MLTGAEKRAIAEYKAELYFKINEVLRNNDTTDEVELLDSAMSKSTIAESCTLYRGTSFSSMELDEDEDEDYTGQVITDLAFVSTTRSQRLAARKYASRGLLLEIEVPAGTKAIEPDEILFENEEEVMLDRGLEFEVVEDNRDEDNRIMKVRIV